MRDLRAFIAANTKLMTPPLVPEIKLHLAEESLPIWQKTEDELGEINVPPPFWAFAWAGGQALARFILDHPELLKDKVVLDLGTGSGLQAIAAKLAGAASVIAADIDAFSCAAAALNAKANGVAIETTSENLLLQPPSAAFTAILVGDLFYEKSLAESVIAFLDQAAANGALVLIGDPQRTYFPRDRFTKMAEYQVPVTRELEDAELKNSSVWRL